MQAPRGTRDFKPDEMAERRLVEAGMREAFRRFGYAEIQTPTFEHLELFTGKSGEAILSELYDFTDKGGRRLALRPELTAPVMRFYYEALAMEPKPLRLYYFGNCFRYDRPQKGRYREFWQMGCELIGPGTPEATGEVIALGVHLLRGAGLNGLVVRIGHLGILNGVLEAIGWPNTADRPALMRLIDKWDSPKVIEALREVAVDEEEIVWFTSLRDVTTFEALREALQRMPDRPGRGSALGALAHLEATVEAARLFGAAGAELRPDPLIARGLDYYTGIVFEMDAPALGAEKQLLGGGAYDLSAVFGGEPVASCGFGLGFDRTLVALEAEGREGTALSGPDVYVAPIGDAPRPRAFALAAELRAAGFAVEVDLMRRNPGKNLKAADTRRARHALILGEKELEAGRAAVKSLDTGTQEDVPLASLVEWLRGRAPPGAGPAAEA